MNILRQQLGTVTDKVADSCNEATKAVSRAIKASPLLLAVLSGCAVNTQDQVSEENVVSEKTNELVHMALQASEGQSNVSTPVVSNEVLRIVIQQKDNPDNTVIGLSGGELGNSFKTYLPEPLPEGQVAVLKAFVDSSCADDSIESCTKKVIMVDVDKQNEQCPEVRKAGDVCAVGNDEAPIPYAW